MSATKRVLNNIFSNWVNFFLQILISFFLAPFVVNSLGSTYYGIWVIMMQFTGYLHLMDFGVRESIIRYVSKYNAQESEDDKGKLSEIISSALILYGAIAPLCLITALIVAYFFPVIFNVPPETVTEARYVVIITGLTLAMFFVFNVYTGIVMAFQRYDIFNKISISTALFRVAAIVYFLNAGYGIIALATIQFFMSMLGHLLVYYFSKKLLAEHNVSYRFSFLSPKKHKQTYKKIFNYSAFVLLNNLGQKAIFHTDAIVIGIFLPAAQITYYAIAGTLADYMSKLCVTGVFVLNPVASELEAKKENAKIKQILYTGCKLSVVITLPISCVYIAMGENFIDLWMGSEFASLSGQLLIILAIMHLYSLPHHTITTLLYGISKHHIIAYIRIIEAAANLILSIILVQYFGLFGIALGTAIPHFIAVVIVLPILIKQVFDIDLKHYFINSYIQPLFAAIPFYYVCYLTNKYFPSDSLLVFFEKVALLMPVYLLACWYLSFSKEEKNYYKSIISKMFSSEK